MPSTFNVFDTDPDAKKERRSGEYEDTAVGVFSAGRQVFDEKSKKMIPEALDTWRIAVSDKDVAAALAQLFGGNVVENEESDADKFIDVFTDRDSIPVVVNGPAALEADMKQWSNGKLVHHCDGVRFLSHPNNDDKIGTLCNCPETWAERKQAAKDGIGPKPDIRLTFRLADDLDLGEFRMRTGSWSLAEMLHLVEEDLTDADGEALADLNLTLVEYTPKKGPMKGKLVSYRYPEPRKVRSFNSAIAED